MVTAERPALEMGVDKRIFNADQSIISKGGTAIDLMKNIPAEAEEIEDLRAFLSRLSDAPAISKVYLSVVPAVGQTSLVELFIDEFAVSTQPLPCP